MSVLNELNTRHCRTMHCRGYWAKLEASPERGTTYLPCMHCSCGSVDVSAVKMKQNTTCTCLVAVGITSSRRTITARAPLRRNTPNCSSITRPTTPFRLRRVLCRVGYGAKLRSTAGLRMRGSGKIPRFTGTLLTRKYQIMLRVHGSAIKSCVETHERRQQRG